MDEVARLGVVGIENTLTPAQAHHRKLHPHRIAGEILVLHLRLGECGFLHHRPHHRLGAAIERAVRRELHHLARDLRFRRIGHGAVVVIPVPDAPEAHELLALHVDPVLGKGAAFAAEFDDRHLVLVAALGAVFLLDLPFDRQAVAIPAGHVV
jgi:hypothetical protein